MDIINGAINVVPSVKWKKRKTYLAFIQYLTGANQKKKILTKNGKKLLKNMTNENIKVSLPAQIVKVETLADNGFKVVVVTNELLPEQAAFLFSLKGSAGWVLFAPNRLKEEDIPPEAAEVPQGEENPMASLQRTLYVYWDKCTKKSQAFNIFLREWVDKKKTEIKVFFPK